MQAGPVGAASALKMSYAGITKGFTALGATMMLAATSAGTADALIAEMKVSQPALLKWLTSQMPRMHSKAYRWVAEMEEIAAFVGQGQAGDGLYQAAAASTSGSRRTSTVRAGRPVHWMRSARNRGLRPGLELPVLVKSRSIDCVIHKSIFAGP